MPLAERIALVNEEIAAAARQAGRKSPEVTLVVAIKMQTFDTIRQAIIAGVTAYGENRVQEATARLDDDVCAGTALHFIDHPQTNRVQQAASRMEFTESVSSKHLLGAIEAQAIKPKLVQGTLLEANVGGETSKSGISSEELSALAAQAVGSPHARLQGLMTIPPVAAGPDGNCPFFAKMR